MIRGLCLIFAGATALYLVATSRDWRDAVIAACVLGLFLYGITDD